MAFVSKNPDFDAVIFKDLLATTPKNPAPGEFKLLNRSGVFYERNSAGTEVPIASAAAPIANIRASEGGGTVTLLASDLKIQRFNLTAAEVVEMPSAGVSVGDIWQIVNPNGFSLSIQASDASLIAKSWGDQFSLVALTTTPVASTDWAVLSKTVLLGRTWTAFVPTWTNCGTITAFTAFWMRTAADLKLRIDFNMGNPAAAAGYVSFDALNINLDTVAVPNTQQNKLGSYFNRTAMTADFYQGNLAGAMVYDVSFGTQGLLFSRGASGSVYTQINMNAIFTVGDSLDLPDLSIPIAEWSEA